MLHVPEVVSDASHEECHDYQGSHYEEPDVVAVVERAASDGRQEDRREPSDEGYRDPDGKLHVSKSDEIRDELLEQGIAVKDTADGGVWGYIN